MARVNNEIDCCGNNESLTSNCLNDLNALSSFLVKPRYVIELYNDSGVLKWKLVTRIPSSDGNVSHLLDCDQSMPELHHKCKLLTLSQMALDLATESPHRTETLEEIHELARQAEVR
jgi:hypothetical protein